jgi:hypothetical protein
MQNVVLNLSITLISKIHQMVYEIYGLTKEEIEIYGLTKEEIEISELKEEGVPIISLNVPLQTR